MDNTNQIIDDISKTEELLAEAAYLAGKATKSAIQQDNTDIEILINKAVARLFNIRTAAESIKPGNQEIRQFYNDEPVYDKIAKQPIVIKQKGNTNA